MAYTTNNRFHQIDTGTEINTWGADVNSTFQRIDDSLGGVLPITVSGTYTLTYANDTTDQAHYAIINAVGTGGTVYLQATKGQWIVRNSGSGSMHFQIAGAAGANAVVHPGDTTVIWDDGSTNVYQASANGVGIADAIAAALASAIAYTNTQAFQAANAQLPGQTGNGGNFLSTNGSNAYWSAITLSSVAGLTTALTSAAANTTAAIAASSATLSAEIGGIVSGGTLTNPTLNNVNLSGGSINGVNLGGSTLTGCTINSPSIINSSTINSSNLNNPTILNANLTGSANLPLNTLFLGQGGGNPTGGSFLLQQPTGSTTLAASLAVQAYGNSFRVFEGGGTARGFYLDLTQCAAGAGSLLWHSGNFTPGNYQPLLGYTPVNKGGDSGLGQMYFAGAATNTGIGYGVAGGIYFDGVNIGIRGQNVGGSTIYFTSYGGTNGYATFNGTAADFDVPLQQNGNQVWHTGNFAAGSAILNNVDTWINDSQGNARLYFADSAGTTYIRGGSFDYMTTGGTVVLTCDNTGQLTLSNGVYVTGNGNFNDVYVRSDASIKSDYSPVSNPLSVLDKLTGYFGLKNDEPNYYVIAQEVEKVLPHLVTKGESELLSVNYVGFIPILIEAVKALSAQVAELKV